MKFGGYSWVPNRTPANWFIDFFPPRTFFFHLHPLPLPRLLIIGESFQRYTGLKRYTYTDFFAISQKEWLVCSVFCFASSCKEANTVFCFVS